MFQYPKVRLKDWNGCFEHAHCGGFQYPKVRLKDGMLNDWTWKYQVSIPEGAIEGLVQKYWSNYETWVSIPEGAIEGGHGIEQHLQQAKFQYPKVRLKGNGRRPQCSHQQVSIPEGAIEGCWQKRFIWVARWFQYPKVRLKVFSFDFETSVSHCFNTRRCDWRYIRLAKRQHYIKFQYPKVRLKVKSFSWFILL